MSIIMSIIVKTDLGWFLDHKHSIDEAYVVTNIRNTSVQRNSCENVSDLRKAEAGSHSVMYPNQRNHTTDSSTYHGFQCKPDLFAIWEPFVMDSQFDKVHKPFDEQSSEFCQKRNEDCNVTPSTKYEAGNPAILPSKPLHEDQAILAAPSNDDIINGVLDVPGKMLICNKIDSSHKSRKRKRKQPLNIGEMASMEEHLKIYHILTTALHQLKTLLFSAGYRATAAVRDNNRSARHAAAACCGVGDFFVHHSQQRSANVDDHSQDFVQMMCVDCLSSDEDLFDRVIEQPAETAVMQMLTKGNYFLLPAKSRFLMSDISRMEPLLNDETKYDCIVIDPPWENKSVKRKKSYNTLPDWDLFQLPVAHLCARNGLVAVWATNKQKQQTFVREQLFKKWNIKYLTKWYWLKVTKSLEPVYEFTQESLGKRPYECILLGIGNSTSLESQNLTDVSREERVVVSIPCSIHSRKPPLNEILQPYLPKKAKCLEMFARSLLPEWTSWGNEVLAFQHLDFFDTQKE